MKRRRFALHVLLPLVASLLSSGCVYVQLGGGSGGGDAGCETCGAGDGQADVAPDLGIASDAGIDMASPNGDAGTADATAVDARPPTDAQADAIDAADLGMDAGSSPDAVVSDAGVDGGHDGGSADAGGADAGIEGGIDAGNPEGGLSGQIDVPGDWGNAALYPDLGGAYAHQVALEGTCTFSASSGAMTIRADDVAQTIVVGLENGAVRVNGATCGSPPATDATIRALTVTVNQGEGEEQVVVLDELAGIFALGNASGGGAFFDLGAGYDRVRIRTTSGSDFVTFGSLGIALNGDAYRDVRHRNVEVFDVSLGSGADTFSAAGGSFGTGADGFPTSVTVLGGPGSDALVGGPHDDVIRGGDGDDTIRGGDGDDALFGEVGNDLFREGLTINGSDRFVGGAGTDTVEYSARSQDLRVTMDGRAADDGEHDEGDSVGADIEDLFGGAGNDVLEGNDLPNQISGGGGNDTLLGSGGDDALDGGDGDDTLDGGSGDNDLTCGTGHNTATRPGNGLFDCETQDDAVYRLSGLVAWFKADAITGSTNNSRIALWPNSADPTRNATQSDGTAKPLYLTDVRNGLPIVRFEEPSQMVTTAVPATGASPRAVFVVARGGAMAWNQDRAIVSWGNASELEQYGIVLNAGWPQYAANFYLDRHYTWSGRINDFQVVSADYDGTTHRFWIDGTPPQDPTRAITLRTGMGPLQLGSAFIGDVAEVLVYAGSLGSIQREAIECALQSKWGTPELGHPCM